MADLLHAGSPATDGATEGVKKGEKKTQEIASNSPYYSVKKQRCKKSRTLPAIGKNDRTGKSGGHGNGSPVDDRPKKEEFGNSLRRGDGRWYYSPQDRHKGRRAERDKVSLRICQGEQWSEVF